MIELCWGGIILGLLGGIGIMCWVIIYLEEKGKIVWKRKLKIKINEAPL